MKITAIVLLLILPSHLSKSQNPEKHFEFGSTLLTINQFKKSDFVFSDRPQVELINGLFFRYTKNRFAIRALVSYSDNYSIDSTPPEWVDGWSREANNKDFRIGIGGQVSILKKHEWLYGFMDILYRNDYSSGFERGGIAGVDDSFTSTTNGIDTYLGLGIKIPVFKSVIISPEFAGGLVYGNTNKSTVSSSKGGEYKYNYAELGAHPSIKLHLTIKF